MIICSFRKVQSAISNDHLFSVTKEAFNFVVLHKKDNKGLHPFL